MKAHAEFVRIPSFQRVMEVERSSVDDAIFPLPVLEFGECVSNGGGVCLPHEAKGIIQFEGEVGRAHSFVFCR